MNKQIDIKEFDNTEKHMNARTALTQIFSSSKEA